MLNKLLLTLFLSSFVFYTFLFIGYENGYYKTKHEKAKELTDAQIIEFEQDIKDGKSIDLKKYVLYEEKDYTNPLSKNVYNVSLKLEKAIDIVIKIIFKEMSKAVTD